MYGPAHITDCVEGKLRGYTWNLIESYPLRIEVHEIAEGGIVHTSFHAEQSFRRIEHTERSSAEFIVRDPLFTVRGLILTHPIPVMAYSLEEEYHINVNKAALDDRGLPVGPWLADLKRAIRGRLPGDTEFSVAGRTCRLDELVQTVTITRGQKISYVTDASPTEENVKKIIPFVRGSDIFFCEAYFLERDRDRAEERNHLTAAMAGRMGREAGVGSLQLMHFSPKYRDCTGEIFREAGAEIMAENAHALPW
jgi:ribonuclease Z